MKALGLENPWAMVIRYLATLPEHCQVKTEIVAVDCVQPSQNRAKVYVRTQASSLHSVIDLMTLGGELSDPSILSAVATFRHLWRLLFSESDESVSIPSLMPEHFASGFSVYFEMRLNRPTPSTKAYIPIRHYCRNDAVIAKAMAQYYREIGLASVGDRYVSDIQRLWYVFLPLVSVFLGPDSVFQSTPRPFRSHRCSDLHWMCGKERRQPGVNLPQS
jgi:DMATS type aromatic prenyltransferase